MRNRKKKDAGPVCADCGVGVVALPEENAPIRCCYCGLGVPKGER